MKNLLIYTLMMLLLKKYVMSEEPCREINVTGAVGGAITLQVGHTGVTNIIWSFSEKGGAIATTTPGGSPVIVENQYKGRLSSTSNGSLIITELRQEDQRTYLAQIITQAGTQKCYYHLTVFSNLTAENITINSNATRNKTCEVILTCSVNGRNVIITWRSLNSSNVNQTENVVFVPPRNINFTYICTAENPVSNVSKTVHPSEYCDKSTFPQDMENIRKYQYIIIGVAFLVIFLLMTIIIIGFRKIIKTGYRAILGRCFQNKKKEALTQEDKNDMNIEDQTGQEQKPEEGRKKSNVKSKQDSAGCLPATVYSQIQHLQAIELQESTSNETTGNTLYSTVQHVKQKNNTTKQPCPSNGKPSKAPPKPPHKVLEPPKGKIDQVESCYAEVQLPKDKIDQKSPSKGLNGDHSMAPMESCYAQVQLPKNCETQYGQVQGMGSKSSNE